MMKLIGFICTVLCLCNGCSIYKAATAPPPLPLQYVKVGEYRNTVLAALGAPQSTEIQSGIRTDIHEFVQGHREVSKARILVYIGGDLFTAGLAELLFWPIELAAGQGTEGRAVVTYGMDNVARSVLITRRDGSAWEYAKNEYPGTAAAAVTPVH